MDSPDPRHFGNWYRQGKLGSGGFGEVVLWRNNENNETIAIKKCRNIADIPYENLEKLKERWRQEVDWMKNLNSEYIVKAVNVEPKEFMEWLNFNVSNPLGLPILVMEYCDGGDLRSELKQIKNSSGLFEFEIRKILKSLQCAICFLHNHCQITHRDIKPENIVIKNTCDGEKLYKLTDLGYAKDIGTNTIDASMVGTKNYFAPEIITNCKYTNAVDYWSIGVIAFELITNVLPFIPHHSIFNYIERLKHKPSNVIAITENNDGTFTNHLNIFRENQISNKFKVLMENWLTMALDYDRKARVEILDSHQKRVTYFDRFDRAINSQILTVFSLSSYEFFSFEVNENTTTLEFWELISRTTEIAINDLYIFTPAKHNLLRLPKNTRPIDLYMDNWTENLPMIYVTRFSKNECLRLKPFIISPTISFVQNEQKLHIKQFVYQEFVRHSLFFLRNEERLYTTYLDGLKNYALDLETRIMDFYKDMDNLRDVSCSTTGYVSFFINNINFGINSVAKRDEYQSINLQNKFNQNCKKVIMDLQKLTADAKEMRTRHNSVLKAVRESIKAEILNDNKKDYFNVKLMEEFYQSITVSRMAEYIKSICDLVSAGINKRRELLNSLNLINTHAEILNVHIEFQKLKEDVTKYRSNLNALKCEIDNCNKQYQLEILEICLCCDKTQSLSNDIDMIDQSVGALHLDNASHELELSTNPSLITIGDDTNRILKENQNLIMALEKRANDIDMLSAP